MVLASASIDEVIDFILAFQTGTRKVASRRPRDTNVKPYKTIISLQFS